MTGRSRRRKIHLWKTSHLRITRTVAPNGAAVARLAARIRRADRVSCRITHVACGEGGRKDRPNSGRGEEFAPARRAARDSRQDGSNCVSAGWSCGPGDAQELRCSRKRKGLRAFADGQTTNRNCDSRKTVGARSGGPDPAALECLASNERIKSPLPI